MPPPRPACDNTIYVMYAYAYVTITVCPCWPASITNQRGLVTLTSDLESGVRVTCDVGYLCANFSLPRPLCCRLRPDIRNRQTDRRQTKSSLNALWGWGIINNYIEKLHTVYLLLYKPML